MSNGQPNIPNTGQRQVRAFMKVKSFISPENPNPKELEVFDKEVNDFLNTIDNQKRFLNGRNAYSVGNKIYALVWYLEKIPDQPVTTPFGPKVKPVVPVLGKDNKNVETKEKKIR